MLTQIACVVIRDRIYLNNALAPVRCVFLVFGKTGGEICFVFRYLRFNKSYFLKKMQIIYHWCLHLTGVESPHAVQKMLSLAQTSRMKQGSGKNLALISPVQSPILPSRGVRLRSIPASVRRTPSISQHRLGSATPAVQPVDLNAESSSVTSMYMPH